jgi:uncharacterized protein YndB with AHSA1/START domain
MTQEIEITIIIKASPSVVWDFLTKPNLARHWMGEPEMGLEIMTDWKVGNPIMIRGFHHVKFENKGKILESEPDRVLKYDYLSSISRLPDKPENHTIIEFRLTPVNDQTSLTLALSNFPNESIFKHVDFYWKTTIGILKKVIERC